MSDLDRRPDETMEAWFDRLRTLAGRVPDRGMARTSHVDHYVKLSDDKIREIQALSAEGVHNAEIGRRVGVSDTTVSRVLKRQLAHARRLAAYDALVKVAEAAREYAEITAEQLTVKYYEAHASNGRAYWDRFARLREPREAAYARLVMALGEAGYPPTRPAGVGIES